MSQIHDAWHIISGNSQICCRFFILGEPRENVINLFQDECTTGGCDIFENGWESDMNSQWKCHRKASD